MKLCSHIRFDLSNGLVKHGMPIRYIVWCLFFILASIEFSGKLSSFEIQHYSYGDYLLYIFGGMREYIPDPNDPFRIPYLWLINHLGILYFTLHYMHDDLVNLGQQTILRSKSRTAWWLSKCIWNFSIVVIFYIISWIIVFLCAFLNQANFSFRISPYMSELMIFGPQQIPVSFWPITIEITVLPLLITLTMSIIQMTLSLFLNPMICYIISTITLISSAYYLSPFLIGNYAMALRSDKVVTNGVDPIEGILISLIFIAISVFFGMHIFKKHNILNKEV